MSTFDWIPDFGYQQTRTPRVRSVKFGDGYEQRTPDGINNDAQKWSVKFQNRTFSESNEIVDFLSARGGWQAFDWIPPFKDDAIRVVCRDWSEETTSYNLRTINATFEQVFEP